MNKRKYIVIGSGAIGLYCAACLCQNKEIEVSLLARSNYEVLVNNGIIVNNNTQNIVINNTQIKIYDNFINLPKFDGVLLAVKGYDINTVFLEAIKNIIKHDGFLLMVQNGIDVESDIAKIIDEKQIISGICWIQATKIEPNIVHHGFSKKIDISPYSNKIKKSDIYHLLSDFDKSNIDLHFVDNFQHIKWEKLAATLAIYGLSVIYLVSVQDLLNKYHNEFKEILQEVIHIALAKGQHIDINTLIENLSKVNKYPAFYPSIIDDYQKAHPMEIDTTFGNTIIIAKKENIQVPKLEQLYEKLQLLEKIKLKS